MEANRVAGARVHSDQVVAELRRHWLRELAGLQLVYRLLELWNESTADTLAEVAALRPGNGVVRFAPGNIFELGAADDLSAELCDLCARRSAVGRGHDTRDRQHAQDRASRVIELFLVRLVVRLQLAVVDLLVRGGRRWTERDERD